MFPFRYNGVIYNTCTLQDSDDENKAWCSTLVDDNNNHVTGGGHYGDCGPKCPLPCGADQFQCQSGNCKYTDNANCNGPCIQSSCVNDGEADCIDGSDESEYFTSREF